MAAGRKQYHGRSAQQPVPVALRALRLSFAVLGPVFPGLMGRWAYRLWIRTRRYPDSAAGRRVVDRAVRETLRVDTLPVAVYLWGVGPVVLFLHGWSGRGSQVAAFCEPLVRAGFQVIAVDAPGHGDTPGNRTNILECVRVVQALDHRYGPVFGAITHSFGGMVLAYAMSHGTRIERAVCISPPAHVDFLVDRFTQALAIPAAVVAELHRLLDQRFEENSREQMSTTENVRQLDSPALIIHDEDDVGVPWQQGELVANAWPGARFLKTRGLGHGRILRDPETVRAAVDFISR